MASHACRNFSVIQLPEVGKAASREGRVSMTGGETAGATVGVVPGCVWGPAKRCSGALTVWCDQLLHMSQAHTQLIVHTHLDHIIIIGTPFSKAG
jgi:hypothetical protein